MAVTINDTPRFTAFAGHRLIAAGSIETVAKATSANEAPALVQIFEDASGESVELDLRRGAAHAVADYIARTTTPEGQPVRQGRGRPRLGVVAREVTLLPRHWDWLANQPGGASAALRRLVEEARRSLDIPQQQRHARETAYRVMFALGGDLPGFEEGSRALFAGDIERLQRLISEWPPDVRDFVLRLASPA